MHVELNGKPHLTPLLTALLFLAVERAGAGGSRPYEIQQLNPRLLNPDPQVARTFGSRTWLPGRHFPSRRACEATRHDVLATMERLHGPDANRSRFVRCVSIGHQDPAPPLGVTERTSPPIHRPPHPTLPAKPIRRQLG